MQLEIECRMCRGSGIRNIGEHHGYCFVECRDCGFVFIPDLNRRVREAAYSGGSSSVAAGAPEKGWAYDLTFLAPAFERLGPEGRREILDFGCGHSRVPDLIRQRGHHVVGIDLEPPREAHTDRLTGSILDMDLGGGRFDLIYSYQVFEHLPEPRPIFDELIRLTRPDGYLLIHTDMDTPQRADGFFGWFYVLPPDHCSYYRKRTFQKTLREHDADIVWSDPWSVLIQKHARGHDV